MKKHNFFGIVELTFGIFFIILGVFTLRNPDDALASFVYIYGIAAILGGIANFVFYATIEGNFTFPPLLSVFSGILNVILGILLITNVWIGQFTLAFIFPAWLFLLCLSRLSIVRFIRINAGSVQYWLTFIINGLGMAVSIIFLFNPIASMLTLTYLIAGYLLIAGIEITTFALGHFRRKDEMIIPQPNNLNSTKE